MNTGHKQYTMKRERSRLAPAHARNASTHGSQPRHKRDRTTAYSDYEHRTIYVHFRNSWIAFNPAVCNTYTSISTSILEMLLKCWLGLLYSSLGYFFSSRVCMRWPKLSLFPGRFGNFGALVNFVCS